MGENFHDRNRGHHDGIVGHIDRRRIVRLRSGPRWDMRELLTAVTAWTCRWDEARRVSRRWLTWPLRCGCDLCCPRLRRGGGHACASRIGWTPTPIRIPEVLALAIMTIFAGSVLMATAASAVDDFRHTESDFHSPSGYGDRGTSGQSGATKDLRLNKCVTAVVDWEQSYNSTRRGIRPA